MEHTSYPAYIIWWHATNLLIFLQGLITSVYGYFVLGDVSARSGASLATVISEIVDMFFVSRLYRDYEELYDVFHIICTMVFYCCGCLSFLYSYVPGFML